MQSIFAQRRRGALTAGLMVALIAMAGCAEVVSLQSADQGRSRYDRSLFQGDTVKLADSQPGVDEFRVFYQGATFLVAPDAVREDAEGRARQLCSRRGQVMKPLRETTSTPPHYPGNIPRIEILFSCETGKEPPPA